MNPARTADAALAELLGLPQENFTARRNQLVKALRAAGEKEEAARLAAVRKPPVHVWAANQLARERTLAVTRLLSAAADLGEAQEKAMAGASGAGQRLRRDSGAYQRALDLALREAAGLLRDGGRPAAEETLRRLREVVAGAALGGDDWRRRLAAGTLMDEPPPSGATAFSFGGTVPAPPVDTPAPRRSRPSAPPAVARPGLAAEQHRRLLAARKAAGEAALAARRLAEVARRARRRADAAAAEAANAEHEAADAESRAEKASRQAEAAAATCRDLEGRG